MKKIYNTDLHSEDLIERANKNYKYQPILTEKLDNLVGEYSETTLLEIVLWKTNRYPELTTAVIKDINDLRQSYSIEKAEALLTTLLGLKGFDLPMASTVLRFASPDNLQILDQRAYRFISEDADEFKIPHNKHRKVEMYFAYLEKLKEVCRKYNIPFKTADRILYQLDKELNADHNIKA